MTKGGPFTFAADQTINFSSTLPSVPLIQLIIQNDGSGYYSTEVYEVTTTYFKCRYLYNALADGTSYTAIGKSCNWIAFKNPGV